jgi:hypothetical protein
MKKVKMLVVVALFAAITPLAIAQHGNHSGHGQHSSHSQPSSGGQQMTRDQLRIAVQQICPVSGEKLGSMGVPVKTKIGQEELFICCDSCRNGQANKDHLATIHANLAKAQGKCPVMNKPLPENAGSTIVQGRIVYTCCPGCKKKIEADPKTYLQKVDSLYAASIKAERK